MELGGISLLAVNHTRFAMLKPLTNRGRGLELVLPQFPGCPVPSDAHSPLLEQNAG